MLRTMIRIPRSCRSRAPFAALVAVLLVQAACTSDGSDPPAPRDYGRIGGASGTELAAVQELHKDNGAEPQTLDPHQAQGVPEGNILRDLFEPLVMEAPDGTLIPGAASEWDVSDDGLVYTFTLQSDGRWSNGDPVTAADFVFSLRRALDPETLSLYASILYPIANAEAVNRGALPPGATGCQGDR